MHYIAGSGEGCGNHDRCANWATGTIDYGAFVIETEHNCQGSVKVGAVERSIYGEGDAASNRVCEKVKLFASNIQPPASLCRLDSLLQIFAGTDVDLITTSL